MSAINRQNEIISLLSGSDKPVSGHALSEHFAVSRQIIVKDIGVLKEQGYDILSTPKGYILDHSNDITCIFKVHHTTESTREELNLFVDLGAVVKDVFIYHRVYGMIRAQLNISSRKDVSSFCEGIESGRSTLLMNTTSGYHYHTIITKDKETMDLVHSELDKHGFLAALTDYEPEGAIGK
ncbi:MAG: transcription repressor NadR [Lachnospiraceae bacterium]|nr:transcription repressor NadR [Lachnospiraceae bacterium]